MATYNKNKTSNEEAVAKSLASLDSPPKTDDLLTESTVNEDGTVTVDFIDPPEEEVFGEDHYNQGHFVNLAEILSDEENLEMASKVIQHFNTDDAARESWLNTIEMGLDLLGVEIEEKNEPFEGACSAQHPLLMESAVKFQSKASNELLPADGPVRTKVLGEITVEKEQQALRVKEHMNYQITEEMTEFYPDTERMLLYLALVGSGFKKTYYNSYLGRPSSEFVPADQFVVPSSAADLQRADRYTHILYKSEYDLEECFASGFYLKPEDLGEPTSPQLTKIQEKTNKLIGVEVGLGERDSVYTLYEQHIDLCIEGVDERKKGYKLASPYVVTVDVNSGRVIGLRRNWKEGDSKRRKIVCFTHYSFVPSFNFYSYGFLHLLGNLQMTLTACMRSLVDAGQFATLQGGFKLKGVRIVDNGDPIHPGQFKEVETAVQDINKAIMTLPFKEPSNVLYQMLNFIDAKGQKFADSSEQVIADSTNYGPVGTTMALLEASNKFFSAIHKRLHASLKHELRIIASINADTLQDKTSLNLDTGVLEISREDYSPEVGIVPVSDPNISSSAHRMAKAQTLYEFAMRAPELHDMREVIKHVYVNMDYANIDKLLPEPEQAQPNDPITDIRFATEGKPIKAFEGQDHKAHIAIKQAFLQDPMSGANPMMQKASITVQANIQEHMLLSFVEATQAQSQGSQDPQAIQQAAQKVAMMNQQTLERQLQEAEQNDAAKLLAQAEMMDTQTQARKQQFDEKYKVADLELKKEKLDMEKVKEMNRADEKRLEMTRQDANLVNTKGLDAMIKGMSDAHAAKKDIHLKRMELESRDKKKDD